MLARACFDQALDQCKPVYGVVTTEVDFEGSATGRQVQAALQDAGTAGWKMGSVGAQDQDVDATARYLRMGGEQSGGGTI
jgi:hypothetical protein